ncbi:head-tail connector protein [Paenibacillus apiarius]|uniref:head-tail connector protein n=1 Tax=Paenibacillus apiarius TaxID=46240 RepID=UPI003B3AF81C
MPTLEEIKTYLRIDGSEDDGILALLVDAAKEYLTDAGVPEQITAKYKLAVMLLVALNYENRNPGLKQDKLSFSLESIILQLKTG